MASKYIAAYKGYVADVPHVWFKRCQDGRIFYFDEITQCQATPNTQFIDINAGWQIFPVAQIPGQSTMEISLTSGQFNSELFELTAGENFNEITASAPYDAYFTETVEFPASGTGTTRVATLSYAPKDSASIFIRGIESGDVEIVSGQTKQIQVTQSPAISGPVEVTYLTTLESGTVANVRTDSSVIGEATLRWPVYDSGDDCSDSGIKGYAELHVYRCRISQAAGFDTSYKSAMTNQITMATMDPKRADNVAYSVAFIELPSAD